MADNSIIMKVVSVCAVLAAGVLIIPPLSAQAPAAAQPAAGQTAAAGLEFDVASIKEAPAITPALVASGKIHIGMKVDGARVDIGGWPLMQLICKAYDVKNYQVQGPDWMKGMAAKRWDIVANLPHGATKDQVPAMLQALLRDRFKLQIHMETKEKNVYALVVGPDGPKLKESAPPPSADGPGVSGSNQATFVQQKNGGTFSDGEHTQRVVMSPDGKSMHLEITNADMSLLAEGLTPLVDRPIVDMTGLKGKYDVTVDLSMADLMAAARAAGANVPAQSSADNGHPADDAADPGSSSLFKAIQQLGLKLEPRKAPLVYLVVDKVEQTPTDN